MPRTINRIRTKQDIQSHTDGHYGPAYPAINVKHYGEGPDVHDIAEHFSCSETIARQALQWAHDSAYSLFWEKARELVSEIFPRAKCYSAGRCGGWLIVQGIGDVESFDAPMLAKWRKLAHAVDRLIDDLAGSLIENIEANRWAEPNAEQFNFVERPNGSTVCLADVARCDHCK